MTYLVESSDDYPEIAVGLYRYDTSPDWFKLRLAQTAPTDFGVPVVELQLSPRGIRTYDAITSGMNLPIISPRFRDALAKRVENEVEFLPVKLIAEVGEVDEYVVPNVLNKVAAVDIENSHPLYTSDGKIMYGFRNMALLDGCMGDLGIARAAEYMGFILVADWLAEELEKERFKGIAFKRPDEIDW